MHGKQYYVIKVAGKWLDPRYDSIDWNLADFSQLVDVHQDNLVDENEEQQQQQQPQQQQQQAKPTPPLPPPAEHPKSSASVPPAMQPASSAAHGALVAERERRALEQVERRIEQAQIEIERDMATAENCGTRTQE